MTARARTALTTLCASFVILGAQSASATTITVNSTADNAANDGLCTLREAMTAASTNTTSGAMANECAAGQDGPAVRDVIVFSLGAGNHVITVGGSGLPLATDQVEVDGRNGTAAAKVELNGATTSANTKGIVLTTGSDGSYVHDIAVNSFPGSGVYLFTGDNIVEQVASGTDLAGTASTLGNGGEGVEVLGDDNTISQALLSANDLNGVGIRDSATGTTVTGSRIGTTKNGAADLGNGFSGIVLGAGATEAADDTTIGGTTGLTIGGPCTGDCNVISGNGLDGVSMQSGAPQIDGATIRGNHIGTDAAGTGAVANSRNGVFIAGVVADALLRENVISGNTQQGVSIGAVSTVGVTTGPSGTDLEANRIGVTAAGTAVIPNGMNGVRVASDVTSGFDPITVTTIGGTSGLTQNGGCTGDCNVISGSTQFGVSVFGNVPQTAVLGNHIGTDVTGTADLGNSQSGVSLASTTAATQTGEPGAGNVISGNGTNGIQVSDTDPGNVIQSNVIGVSSDGAGAIGNTNSGIALLGASEGVLIGGTGAGEGNKIEYNGDEGIEMASASTDNPVLSNVLFANGDLGIDLGATLGSGDGVTPNDGLGDADTGGNNLQNFPELAAAVADDGSTFVAGSLDSAEETSFRIEVFSTPSPDSSGFGEGRELLDSFVLSTDGQGAASFTEDLSEEAEAGDSVSATATRLDSGGDPVETSEFSEDVTEGCDVEGTGSDDDLTGLGSSDDVICGFGGDDDISPDGGDDVVVGGEGTDKAKFSDATEKVDVDLAAGSATVGADSLAVGGIENVTGGDKADTITGDDEKNTLKGGDGKDTIEAGGGGDTLDGGDGDDTLKGQDGGDTVKGKDDDDDLRGGDGGDDLKGGEGKKDDLDGGDGKDSLDGGDGKKDVCDGGPDHDEKHAPGCETKKSLP